MADPYLASNEFPGDGVQTLFNISFKGNRPDAGSGATPYLNPADVKAQVITPATSTTAEVAVDVPCVYVGPNQFSVTPATPVGKITRIYRATQDEYALVDYQALQTVGEADLDLSNRQLVFITQEAHDQSMRSIATANNAATVAYSSVEAANQAAADSTQALATANNAQATAQASLTNATNALAIANSAEDTADAALDVANGIAGTADAALTAANAATVTANNAAATANGIAGTANSALTTANSALSVANDANNTANGISGTANTALTNANAAIATANNAEDVADAAAASAAAATSAVAAKANKGANSDITSLTGLTTPLSLSQGGTGRTDGLAWGNLKGTLSSQTDLQAALNAKDVVTVTNANGVALKYPDGTMICYFKANGDSQAVTSAVGALFQAGAELTWTYPAAFVAPPVINAVASRNDGTLILGVFIRTVSASAATWRIWSSTSIAAGNVKDVYFTAIGRYV